MLGQTLGSYRILSLIGEGGMGRVYLAEHKMLGRKVALKLLRPEYAVKRDAVARFFQEARSVNTIGHENIVDITDFVEQDSGETYIIMELLQGEDLSDVQRKSDHPIPLHRAMQIAMQVCDALEAAHASGIVHRDLKPDNIFIVNDSRHSDFVKVVDFGVAKLLDSSEDDGWQTAAGAVIGTPAYMSPEQASGIPVDHRSDIYSLGAILYELFTGHPVFRAKSFGEFVVKHMNDDPIPPRDLADAPSIPTALERVILRCLEKDPARRYQSVSELREDLARATATVETMIRARPVGPADDDDDKKRSRTLLVVMLAIGIVGLAGGAFWIAAGLGLDDPSPRSVSAPVAGAADDPAATKKKPASPGEKAPTARMTLRTRPSGARVYRRDDSISMGLTPLEIRLSNLGEEVEFVFKLKGYANGRAKVVVEDNTMIGVDLEKIGAVTSVDLNTRTRRGPGKKRRRTRKPRTKTSKTDPAPDPKKVPPKKIDRGDQVDPFSP